jgi:hypothetical protein
VVLKENRPPDGVLGLLDKESPDPADEPQLPSQHELCSRTWQAAKCEKGKQEENVVPCRTSPWLTRTRRKIDRAFVHNVRIYALWILFLGYSQEEFACFSKP